MWLSEEAVLPQQSLKAQGLVDDAILSYVYEPASLQDAWKLIHGYPVDDASMALESHQKSADTLSIVVST